MRIGVKYCGGCNPRYDRVKALDRLRSQLVHHRFFLTDEEQEMDVLLVLAGCGAACAEVDSYAPAYGILWLKGPECIERVERRLGGQTALPKMNGGNSLRE